MLDLRGYFRTFVLEMPQSVLEDTRLAIGLCGSTAGSRCRNLGSLSGKIRIHSVRSQIDLAGPCYRAIVNEDPVEKMRVPQRSECASQFFFPQLNTPR